MVGFVVSWFVGLCVKSMSPSQMQTLANALTEAAGAKMARQYAIDKAWRAVQEAAASLTKA